MLQATLVETPEMELAREDANRALYALLITDDAFVNRNPFDTTDTQCALYRAPWIQQFSNSLWFGKKSKSEGLGLAFPNSKIPLPALALAITAYEDALDEWREGYLNHVLYSAVLGKAHLQQSTVTYVAETFLQAYRSYVTYVDYWTFKPRAGAPAPAPESRSDDLRTITLLSLEVTPNNIFERPI
ncbi:hypothetical protein BDP27DRAFT_1366401 [Rhodocollybia butyracea]|uniref:DUF6532 domain-containing protein n=1 Tax=Rhodocollybia butyracea TaxID=206335 RepID=A0A9P5U577_9AGAR|nr:hypothetical protein BDP27DRAFT_1366401 [Rhodocollybia butyracea]